MKAIILYDSAYGNTEKIARAIGDALGTQNEVSVVKVSEARPDQCAGLDLFIVGAPTQRFRTTMALSDFLKRLPDRSLKGVKVAAFDTRLSMEEINKMGVLAFFVKLFGTNAYAARPITNQLKKKGGVVVGTPEGFYVKGMEGPLAEGELERAVNWARQIAT
jgi:flavodoxin I